VRTSFAFCPLYLEFPAGNRDGVQSAVKDDSSNPISSRPARITAEQLYQGATILAALLLVLSAAV
jgi:hypothetical protein